MPGFLVEFAVMQISRHQSNLAWSGIFDLWLPITVDCHTDSDAGAVVAGAASESLHLAAHLRVAA